MIDHERKRTWAEVSLSAVEHNYREIRRVLPETTRFLGVVKADAYGHGAVAAAHRLETIGADYLAVATIDEGIRLRRAGCRLPILILGATDADYAPELARCRLTQAVESAEKGFALSDNLPEGEKLRVHIKLDTGMGRIGFRAADSAELLAAESVMKLPNLIAEGVFMHFAVSDEPGTGEQYTREQFDRFERAYQRLEHDTGMSFTIRHCGNSGCVLSYREYALDMVRPGLLTYGLYPAGEHGGLDLIPAMQLKSRIAAITHHKKGDTISYGRIWTAERDSVIAVLPIGYADGLHRTLSGRMEVLVRGRRAPQVGRICMDMCMIDVTDVPAAAVGDVVTLFGRDGDAVLPIEEMAEKAGTISYEILCGISPRVPRIYMDS